MGVYDIIAQSFGIIGLLFNFWSFQEKNNKKLFGFQAMASMMFFINYFMIGAISGMLFNISGMLRGMLYRKSDKKLWKVIVVVLCYVASYIISLTVIGDNSFQVFLTTITFIGVSVMTVLMWLGNGRILRIGQVFICSPAWLIHNCFNFTLGGIISEILNILSVIISFIRYGKDGFEK